MRNVTARNWRTVVACLLFGLMAMVGGRVSHWLFLPRRAEAQGLPRYAKMIETQGLRIVDDKGTPRLGLAVTKGLAMIQCLDSKGKVRLALAVDPNGDTMLTMFGASGPRLVLQRNDTKGPAVQILERDGKNTAVSLSCVRSPDGKSDMPGCHLYYTGSNRPAISLATTPSGPMVGIFDKDTKPIWAAP